MTEREIAARIYNNASRVLEQSDYDALVAIAEGWVELDQPAPAKFKGDMRNWRDHYDRLAKEFANYIENV